MSAYSVVTISSGEQSMIPEPYEDFESAMARAVELWRNGDDVVRIMDQGGEVLWDSRDAVMWQYIGPLMAIHSLGRKEAICVALRDMGIPLDEAKGIFLGLTGDSVSTSQYAAFVYRGRKKIREKSPGATKT